MRDFSGLLLHQDDPRKLSYPRRLARTFAPSCNTVICTSYPVPHQLLSNDIEQLPVVGGDLKVSSLSEISVGDTIVGSCVLYVVRKHTGAHNRITKGYLAQQGHFQSPPTTGNCSMSFESSQELAIISPTDRSLNEDTSRSPKKSLHLRFKPLKTSSPRKSPRVYNSIASVTSALQDTVRPAHAVISAPMVPQQPTVIIPTPTVPQQAPRYYGSLLLTSTGSIDDFNFNNPEAPNVDELYSWAMEVLSTLGTLRSLASLASL